MQFGNSGQLCILGIFREVCTGSPSQLHTLSQGFGGAEQSSPMDASYRIDQDMELTETGGRLLPRSDDPGADSDSDMELTEVGGRVLDPDASQLDSSALSMSFTAAAGMILDQSSDGAAGNVNRALRVRRLQELKRGLVARRRQLLQSTGECQQMAARVAVLDQEAARKHHVLDMEQRAAPLVVTSVATGHLTVAFQGFGSALTFEFGPAARTGSDRGPLPVQRVHWSHEGEDRAALLQELGVISVVKRVKHSKQIRRYLQEVMALAYANGKALGSPVT